MSLREIVLMRLFRTIRDRVIPLVDKGSENLGLHLHLDFINDWSTINKLFPDTLPHIIEEADEILENCFLIFGQKVKFDSGVDWNRDFFTQKHWPIIPTFKLDFRDGVSGDPKDIWELNRHAFLLPLAKAWRITQDSKYASKIVDLIDSWIVQCPAYRGINWSSCIEFSIRQLNWIWALKLIADSKIITKDFLGRVARSMYTQTRYIEKHLSLYSSANNHLISELCALVVVGRFLGVDHWVKIGKKLLDEYLEIQILSDGTGAEQAPSYLAHTMEFYALSLLEFDDILSTEKQNRLYNGALYLKCMMGKNGFFGQFGDSDSGHILPLGTRYSELKSLFNLMSVLCNRPTLMQPDSHQDEKLFWLLGEKRYRTWLSSLKKQKPNIIPQYFPVGGYYVLQKIWDGQYIRLIFDCGPLGLPPLAAHGHMDALSFILEIEGESILVDPGTYTYFKDLHWRDYFRSTRAHNTITIDDRDQSVPSGRFLYKQQAKAVCLEFQEGCTVMGYHDGYTRFSDPVVHTRRISVDSERKEFSICDKLTCKSNHLLQIFFHFNPLCQVERLENFFYEGRLINGPILRFYMDPQATWKVVSGLEENPIGWYSPRYNEKVPAPCLVGQMQINNPGVWLTTKIHLFNNREL